ncbi:MAG: DUF2207 domain-containing protein, partial [Chloroflexi bacterium]|nr:DUF2207 domain-containing protein [Chloroflexota bacterium]
MIGRANLAKRLIIFPLLLLTLLLSPNISSAQTKSFYWERFDVDITLLENGDMRVVETQVLNFSGAPFTYGYGGIYTGNNGNNDSITNIGVRDENGDYDESFNNDPRTFEVDYGSDEVTINWYFEPTVGRRAFQFNYTVIGGVQVGSFEEGDGDQIYWKAIPADHPSWIEASTVT